MKAFLNVLGIIAATLLSFVLIAAFVLLRDRRMRKARQATPPSLGEVM